MKHKRQSGFTLVEILLSLALFSILAIAVYSFAWNISLLNARGELARSLSMESRFISARLAFLIRNADGIASISGDRLSLEKPGGSGTIDIFLRGEMLFVDDGSSEEALSGSDIRITNFAFEDRRAESGLSETVGFSLTMNGKDVASDSVLHASTALRGMATVRSFPSP